MPCAVDNFLNLPREGSQPWPINMGPVDPSIPVLFDQQSSVASYANIIHVNAPATSNSVNDAAIHVGSSASTSTEECQSATRIGVCA